jgi:hypothetical protein
MVQSCFMTGLWGFRSQCKRWLIVAFAGVAAHLAVQAQTLSGPLVCPINGHSYYLLAESSWQDAEALAVTLKGHLVTLRSAEEQAWVFGQFGEWGGQSRSLWMGLRRTTPGGVFEWVSGEPLAYTHWLPGQPDDSPATQGESFVHMLNSGNAYGHPGGYWNDLASPNSVFTVFDPVCGVVEIIPPPVPKVRLSVIHDSNGWRVQAEAPPATVRLVWEMAPSLLSPAWSVVAVQLDASGRILWNRTIVAEHASEFLRVRAYDSPGFNARLDRMIQEVRIWYPEAVLLESYPILSSTVTDLPDRVALRAVLRVTGGTVVSEQTDPWTNPQIDFRAVPWMGDMDLPWPVAMNLEEAESALREAGFGSEYKTVTLRRPVYPGMTEPYFIFGTPNQGFVFVGTVTRKVFRGN